MSKIDYKKLTEITVKNQKELDDIPLDFKGRIHIEFGTPLDRAIVKNKYYYSVVARNNSTVVAYNNSTVVACNNSTVRAYNNSTVEAWDNSTVEAYGNTQVLDRQDGGKINISGNARIVYMPKNINDFIDFYGIKHTKTKAIFYKAVRKDKNGCWQAYGLPYAGSSGIYRNEKAPVSAIIVLRQAYENRIQRLGMLEIIQKLYPETTVHQWESVFVEKALTLLTELAGEVPVYLLECRPDKDAVEAVKYVLIGGGNL